jgi:hypothetical protein
MSPAPRSPLNANFGADQTSTDRSSAFTRQFYLGTPLEYCESIMTSTQSFKLMDHSDGLDLDRNQSTVRGSHYRNRQAGVESVDSDYDDSLNRIARLSIYRQRAHNLKCAKNKETAGNYCEHTLRIEIRFHRSSP